MNRRELASSRTFLVKVEHNAELIKFITDLAKEEGIITGTFTAIGALKNAKLGFYDQKEHRYVETLLSASQEIASCTGNISLKQDEPFVHAHVVLTDAEEDTRGGHLLEGIVFAAEIHLIELTGEKITRTKDAVTGLYLWDI